MTSATRRKTEPTASDYAEPTLDSIEFDVPPPGVFMPEENGALLGRFYAASLSPEDSPTAQEYGQCVIVEFEAIEGRNVQSKDGPVDLVPGEHYSLWLTSQTLHDGFVDAKPELGELFKVQNFGTRTSRTRKDAKTGEPIEYALFRVVFPERPKVERVSMDWSTIALKGKQRN